jgi:NAD(P)-dependent dehydrogenase (short-subunit alcohol dehydrogenase family)
MTNRKEDRVVVVTGASRGIGRATALALAEAGAHVIAVARTVGALEELDDEIRAKGGAATLVPLDLKDFAGIDRLGAAIFSRWGRLDGLLGNAGLLGAMTPLAHLEPKVWEDVMAVNVTANWRLIRAMDPLLQRSTAARVVFLTSGVTARAIAYWGPYSVSKNALEMLARVYAAENATTNLRVNLFNPGPIRTRMRAQAMPGEDPMTLATPDQAAEKVVELCLPSCTDSGKLYNFPTRSLMEFCPPTPRERIANSE